MKTTRSIPLTLFGTLLVLTGCVSPLPSSKEALEQGRSGDGVIVGSVLLEFAELRAATNNLCVTVRVCRDGQFFPRCYSFTASSNHEKIFIGSLPAGDYWVDLIRWRVIVPTASLGDQEKLPWDWCRAERRFTNRVHPGVRFHVNAGQTTYLGQLVVNLPMRVEVGRRFTVEVRDQEQKTLEALRTQNSPQLLSGLQKKLMTATVQEMRLVEPPYDANPGLLYNPVILQPRCHQPGGSRSHCAQPYHVQPHYVPFGR